MTMRAVRSYIKPERIIVALICAATMNLVMISTYPLMDARAAVMFDVPAGPLRTLKDEPHRRTIRLANDLPLPCRDGRFSDGRPRSCKELLRWMQDEEDRQNAADPRERAQPCHDGRMSDGRPRTCDELIRSLRRTM